MNDEPAPLPFQEPKKAGPAVCPALACAHGDPPTSRVGEVVLVGRTLSPSASAFPVTWGGAPPHPGGTRPAAKQGHLGALNKFGNPGPGDGRNWKRAELILGRTQI